MTNYTQDPSKEMEDKVQEYVDSGGNHCLFCGSENIVAAGFADAGEPVECLDCGKTWLDCYELVSVLFPKE